MATTADKGGEEEERRGGREDREERGQRGEEEERRGGRDGEEGERERGRMTTDSSHLVVIELGALHLVAIEAGSLWKGKHGTVLAVTSTHTVCVSVCVCAEMDLKGKFWENADVIY